MSLIYLIGSRGSGKTTIGRKLSFLLRHDFLDLDHYLCTRENKTIEEIVKESGWEKFRQIESEVLAEATALQRNSTNTVFATGGGIILSQANRDFLRKTGKVFWLKVGVNTLRDRLAASLNKAQRPSLTNANPLAEIEHVLNQREKLYSQTAHYIINGDQDVSLVCSQIISHLDTA